MKRDLDLVRRILLYIENGHDPRKVSIKFPRDDIPDDLKVDRSATEVLRHIEILSEAGLTGTPSTSSDAKTLKGGDKHTNCENAQLIDDAVQEDQVRLNADVPKSLRKQVQIQAAKEERPMHDVVIDAVTEYLRKHSSA